MAKGTGGKPLLGREQPEEVADTVRGAGEGTPGASQGVRVAGGLEVKVSCSGYCCPSFGQYTNHPISWAGVW